MKFRGLVKSKKQMVGVAIIEWNPDSTIKRALCVFSASEPEDTIEDWVSAADLELMQCTEMTDELGREIYVGDVIRCSATQREINDELEDAVVQVSYSDGYFYPFGYNCGWRSSVYDIELIGNIYENPELTN